MANRNSFGFTSQGLAALGLIAAASYILLTEHRQHLWTLLPFLILLACPLMHLFMHRSHGGHCDTQPHHHPESKPDDTPGQEDERRENPRHFH